MLNDYGQNGSYQAAEVLWYRENGKHLERIQKDSTGRRYVISDRDWNRGGRPAEFIEPQMQRELGSSNAQRGREKGGGGTDQH